MAKTFISARWLLVGLLWLTLWLAPGLAQGQSRELIDSTNRTLSLYGQGLYQEALPFAKKAVRLGEQEFGTNHPFFAVQLYNLAGLNHQLGRYAEAEPLYHRALAILEKSLGPEQPPVVKVLFSLALFYRAQGRYAEAEPLLKRSLAIQAEQRRREAEAARAREESQRKEVEP